MLIKNVLKVECVLVVVALGIGCESTGYGEREQEAMRELLVAKDWAGLTQQMKGGYGESGTWRNLTFALDKVKLSKAETDALLVSTVNAELRYARPETDELLAELNPDVLTAPAKF